MYNKRTIFTLVVLTLIFVSSVSIAAVPLTVQGRLRSELRYTPENLWEGGTWLETWMVIGSKSENRSATVNISTAWQDELENTFFDGYKDIDENFSMDITRTSIEIDGPLVNLPWADAKVTLGDQSIRYSDWIAYFDDRVVSDAEDSHLKGISISGLEIPLFFAGNNTMNTSGFYAWLQDERKLVAGVNLETQIKNRYDLTFTGISQKNRDKVEEEDDTYYDDSDYEVSAIETTLDLPLNKNVDSSLTYIYAQFKDITTDDWILNKAPFIKADLNWRNTRLGDLEVNAYYTGEEMDPDKLFVYYNKWDDDDPYTEELNNYLSRSGLNMSLTKKIFNTDFNYGIHTYKTIETSNNHNDFWIAADRVIRGLDFGGRIDYKTETDMEEEIKLATILSNQLYSGEMINLAGNLINHYTISPDKISDTEINTVLKVETGAFEGLSLTTGIQMIEEYEDLNRFVNLNYETPGGLNFFASYADENVKDLAFDSADSTNNNSWKDFRRRNDDVYTEIGVSTIVRF